MLSVVEKFELLDRAERLAANRDFQQLDRLTKRPRTPEEGNDPALWFYRLFAATQLGNASEALEAMREFGPSFELLQDTRLYRRFRNVSGILLTQVGRLNEAKQAFAEVLGESELAGDLQLAADAVMNLGVVADMYGQWDEALAAHWRALNIFAQLADQVMLGGCHHNIGMTYRQLGLLNDADAHFQLALEIYSEHGTRFDILTTVLERSLVLTRLGDGLIARTIALSAYKETRLLRNPWLRGEAQRILGMHCVAASEYQPARRYSLAALRSARRSENRLLEAETSAELAGLSDQAGSLSDAEAWRARAVEIYTSIGCLGRAMSLSESRL